MNAWMRLIQFRRQHWGTWMLQRVDRVRFAEYTVTIDRARDQSDSDRYEIGWATLRAELWVVHKSPTRHRESGRLDNPGRRRNPTSLAERRRGDVSCQIGGCPPGAFMRTTKPFTPVYGEAVGGCGPVVLKPRSWDLGFATAPPSIVNAESDRPDDRIQSTRFHFAARRNCL